MTTFEIYFLGLICFYAPEDRYGSRDYKTEALFVDDPPDHTRIVITSTERFGADFSTISLSHAPGKVNAKDHDFQECVPHLADSGITRRHVSVKPSKIRLALPNGAVAHVAQLFDHRGRYALDQTVSVRRVCRLSVLTLDADALAVTVDNGAPHDVTGDSWVAILNYSKQTGGSGTDKNHFHRYAKISNGAPGDVAEVSDDDGSPVQDAPFEKLKYVKTVRELPEIAPTHVLNQTQCSNSNWP